VKKVLKTTRNTIKNVGPKVLTIASKGGKKAPKSARVDYAKLSLALHKRLGGKIALAPKAHLKSRTDWSTFYTPGVAAVSSHLAKHPKDARVYTLKKNTVAVISDGSAVLGLGNIGPMGAIPVMEGKCVIFKEMANVDAFPIVLDTQDPEEIIRTIKAIAPVFGGINLEDFAAPNCFIIEERLKAELTIPVMHDDQHGTAIVVLAGLINASKVVGKKMQDLKVVVVGAGAAGRAVALLLLQAGIKDITLVDRSGVIELERKGLSGYKKELARVTNPRRVTGDIESAMKGADVVVGVSGPGKIARAHVELMAEKPIVFALANPIPEIMPEDALRAGAFVVATGRSDFPNQINNALVFPGIFRGALDRNVTTITDAMKLAAAKKLASLVKKPSAHNVIPKVETPGLAKAIASVIR
jgi:malate dehydrogenase (oxaloacetate-decarboxylating)